MLWCTFVVGGYVLSRINGVIAIIIVIAAVLFEFFGLIFSTKNEERIYKIIGFCLGGEKSPLFCYV